MLALQANPAGHELPQLPQCDEEVCRFDSQPLSGEAFDGVEQSPKPGSQVGLHLEDSQAAVNAWVVEHARPQAPQALIELTMASQPSLAMPLQSPKPSSQFDLQTPAEQDAVLWSNLGQGSQDVSWQPNAGFDSATQVPPHDFCVLVHVPPSAAPAVPAAPAIPAAPLIPPVPPMPDAPPIPPSRLVTHTFCAVSHT